MTATRAEPYAELTSTETATSLEGLVAVGAQVDEGPWRPLVLVKTRVIAQTIVRELESHPSTRGRIVAS